MDNFKKLEFPNRITVELTNRCNVSCTFCPRQTVNMTLGDMDWNLYKKIIDEASLHLPVKLVCFFRGESILHPQFIEFARYAKNKGIGPIQFASNGKGLTEELAEEILDVGIDFISFSLDTIDRGVYSRSRLTGDLDLSMKNVISFSKKCRERKRKRLFAPVLQVSTIEIEEYLVRQKEFIEFWQQYVDIVRVYYEHDDKGHFANQEVKMYFAEMTERKPCRKVFTDFLIYWNGYTALCNYDWNGYIKNLNVKDMSIKEIWDSKEYEDIRQMHYNNTFCKDIVCKDCDHWRIDYVDNGCLGKVYKNSTV
ncbi:putative mycofactocin radical SAM maturase MftC [Lachnospiraceae bacterium]|jgi:Radical SAM superfamily.|nr:radical SAM protein [Lachnospiraceae bacterium]GFI16897.1 putative mycofactocin radical SAM maturase MftC [Lachnospiraceae bacterium]GFI69132.1 putative mycofactocin radical SAM maturase MftC [Lachnospiraceae bacterium]